MIRLLFCLVSTALLLPAQRSVSFEVVEGTIAQAHDAMKAGRLTCRELVGYYLKRIEAYDKNGPGINSIVMVNPEVEKQADELDRRFAQSGLTGSLRPSSSRIISRPKASKPPMARWRLPAFFRIRTRFR